MWMKDKDGIIIMFFIDGYIGHYMRDVARSVPPEIEMTNVTAIHFDIQLYNLLLILLFISILITQSFKDI